MELQTKHFVQQVLDVQAIESMQYMGAFMKEATRLYPFTHCHIRTLQEDTVLSGYHIPAGT